MSIPELTKLLKKLGMCDKDMEKCYDPTATLAFKHPCINPFVLEDFLISKYDDYTEDTCMAEWFKIHFQEDYKKIQYYLGIDI